MRCVLILSIIAVAGGSTLMLAKPVRPEKEAKKPPLHQWGKPVEGHQLCIVLPKKIFIVGEQIPVTVKVKNASDQDLSVTSHLRVVWFDVKDAQGQSMPLTRFGQRVRPGRDRWGALGIHVLKPGQVMTLDTPIVNREHDMTLSGTYKIRAWMKVGRRDRKGAATVFSNEVTIKVEETPK